MESLIILIPLSLLAVSCAVWFFFNMSNSGQFDDDQGPAWSVLLDDDRTAETLPAATKTIRAVPDSQTIDLDQNDTRKDI